MWPSPAWSPSTQDRLIALGVFALGAALYLLGFYGFTDSATTHPLWLRFALLSVLAGAELLRRNHPVAALCIATPLFLADLALGASLPVWIIVADLVYAGVLYAGAQASRRICVATGIVVLALASATVIITNEVRLGAYVGILALLILGSPVSWALSIREHKGRAEAEREKAQAQAVIAELDRRSAVAEERTTMARDLHDVIAGHLSAIALQSEAALSVEEDPARARAILRSIRENSVDALHEMRTMIDLLRSAEPQAPTLPPRLSDLPRLVALASAAGNDVTLSITVGSPLPRVVDHTAYRIAQEALTNALKHAPGAPVTLTVTDQGGRLRMRVSNPCGEPRTPKPGQPLGLANMRDRAHALGGKVEVAHTRQVWVLDVVLPLTREPGQPLATTGGAR